MSRSIRRVRAELALPFRSVWEPVEFASSTGEASRRVLEGRRRQEKLRTVTLEDIERFYHMLYGQEWNEGADEEFLRIAGAPEY